MFCTKCGKELYPGDKFCAHCGCEIRSKAASKYDDIVFNPPFKQEARRKTEEIVGFVNSREPEAPVRKTEQIKLDWGMEKTEQKKPQAVSFDWSQVLEQKSRQRKIEVEKLDTSNSRHFFVEKEKKPELTVVGFAQPASTIVCEVEETPLSIEELEKEIFGEIETESHIAEHLSDSSEEAETGEMPMETADSDDSENGDVQTTEEENNIFIIADEGGEILTEPPESEKPAEDEPSEEDVKDELNDFVVVDPEDVKVFGDERFYTYNQKCGAFDELIQKEKERLDKISDGEYRFASDESDNEIDESDPDQETMDINIEELPPITDSESEYLALFPPEKTIAVEPVGRYDGESRNQSVREDFKAPFMQEAEKEAKEGGETKLRYSDVFPRVPVDENGNPIPGYEEPKMMVRHEPVVPQIIAQNKARQAEERKNQDNQPVYNKRPEKTETEIKDLTGIFDPAELQEDKPKKKHIFSKIIITLLVLLLLAEGVVLGTKLLAPESPFSIWINEKALGAVEYIFSKFNPQEDTAEDDNAIDDHMNLLVSEASVNSKKIGEVLYDRELKFSIMPDYIFPEVAESSEFVDEDWYIDEDSNMLTYGQVLMKAIVKYYDKWNKTNEDNNLVGINVLEIGETRTTNDGFYTLSRLTLATADGGQAIRYQTAFCKVSDQSIVINMVKEETINEG